MTDALLDRTYAAVLTSGTPEAYVDRVYAAVLSAGIPLAVLDRAYVAVLTDTPNGGGEPVSETFSTPITLLGATYAAGDPLPPMSEAVKRHLVQRGYVAPSSMTVKREFRSGSTTYTLGAAVAGGVFVGAALRRLLRRGRYLGP